MASLFNLDRLSGVLNTQRLNEILATHRTAVLSTLGLGIALPVAIKDYRTYLSYGPGGLPYNPIGWFFTNLMRPFQVEQLSARPYDNDASLYTANESGYLAVDFPPPRCSARPALGPHPIPQRQLDQLPNEEMRQQLIERFDALGIKAERAGLVDIKQSLYERRHSALFVSKTREWHALAEQTRGEISHVHAGLDGTIHVVLHPDDCKKVLNSGWGQRHGFSGAAWFKKVAGITIPLQYVLIYAPRDVAEIDVALTIVRASIQFMTGSRDSI